LRWYRAGGITRHLGDWPWPAPSDGALELFHFSEAEEVGQRRLCAHVLIGSIRVKPIQAPARLRIDQGCTQIVLTEKPAERTHCLLTLSKHALGVSAPMPKHDPFMSEHRSILESVARGDVGGAENMLRKHLEDSCLKLIRRIDSVRTNYAAPKPPYINERSGSD